MQFMRKAPRGVLLRFQKLKLQAGQRRRLLLEPAKQNGGGVYSPGRAGQPKRHATGEGPHGPMQQAVAFFIDALAQQFALLIGGFKRGVHLLAALRKLIENFFAPHIILFARQLQPALVQFVLLLFDGLNRLFGGGFAFGELRRTQVDLAHRAPGDEDGGQQEHSREQYAGDDDAMPLGSYANFFVLHHDDSFIKILSRESPIDAMARKRDSGQSRDVGGEKNKNRHKRGERK